MALPPIKPITAKDYVTDISFEPVGFMTLPNAKNRPVSFLSIEHPNKIVKDKIKSIFPATLNIAHDKKVIVEAQYSNKNTAKCNIAVTSEILGQDDKPFIGPLEPSTPLEQAKIVRLAILKHLSDKDLIDDQNHANFKYKIELYDAWGQALHKANALEEQYKKAFPKDFQTNDRSRY